MKIALVTDGGYKGFTIKPTEKRPVFVEAEYLSEFDDYDVKVSDLVALGVYSIEKGLASGLLDFDLKTGTIYFHSREVEKMGKVKVRILNEGGYSWRDGHNRTFPVIVNGYRDERYFDCVHIDNADAKAIGVYIRKDDNLFNPTFCLEGHLFGAEAEIL